MLRQQRISGIRCAAGAWPMLGALLCLLHPALSVAAQAPRALLAATSHDFGIIKQGARIGHIFTVRNEGTAALTLELLELTQPGMTARFKPDIPPAGEATMRLEWDTSRVKGPVVGMAVVRLNDPLRPEVRFVLNGTVQPPIEFQPFAAIFLSAFRGESVQRAVRIVNNELRPLKIVGMEPSSDRFTAAIQTVQEGKTYELRVSARPDAPFGRVQEPLFLLTDHPEQSRLRVLVNVLIKPDVYVNPEAVDFGQVQMAVVTRSPGLLDLLRQTFMVKIRHGEMQLNSVHSNLDFLEIKQSPPGGKANAFRMDVGLIRELLKAGPIEGSIIIETNDPEFPKLSVPVRGAIIN